MLKQANCIKQKPDGTAFSLQADAGESFLIRNIIYGDDSTTGYPVLRVDRKTVGCYRAGAQGANHLGHIETGYIPMNLMDWLMGKGINMAIPVAEGQRFTIDRAGDAGKIIVIYDIYANGDILATMPNGSESKEYNFIQYMTASAALATAVDHRLDVSLSPAEFPDFPCGKVVPARHIIDILGIAGCPVRNGQSESFHIDTTYLKLTKDREILFDEDRDGIPFLAKYGAIAGTKYVAEVSLIGDCVSIPEALDSPSYGLPLMFDPPLHFVSGEELLVDLTCQLTGSGSIPVANVRVAMIMNVKVE